MADLTRRMAAEAIGTALLLTAVVGSGIMAERLSAGNNGVALLANAIATGGALVALILTFGPVSGAQFNPVVSLALTLRDGQPWRTTLAYLPAQIIGAIGGVWAAHLMFTLPVLQVSAHGRATPGEWLGEVIATFGLLGVIFGCLRRHAAALPGAVAAYITGAYWFTSSTSFANPAVTIARALTDTFAGIDPAHAPAFILAQLVGLLLAVGTFGWLMPAERPAGS